MTFTGEPARVFRRFPLAPWPAEFRRLRYPPALAPIRDRAPASRQARLTARKGSSASSASSSCLRRNVRSQSVEQRKPRESNCSPRPQRSTRNPMWPIGKPLARCLSGAAKPPAIDILCWHYPEAFEGANEFRSLRSCGPVLLEASSSLHDPNLTLRDPLTRLPHRHARAASAAL
jgi:hypothetical protein